MSGAFARPLRSGTRAGFGSFPVGLPFVRVGALLAAGAAGLLLVRAPMMLATAVALGLLLTLAATTFSRPRAAFVGVLAVLVFIPAYAAPTVASLPLPPAVVALWCIAAALLARAWLAEEDLHFGLLDAAVLLLFVVVTVPVLYGVRAPKELIETTFLWAGAYLAARMVVVTLGSVGPVARAVGVLGILTLPLVLAEALGLGNPFLKLGVTGTASDVWVPTIQRAGQARPEAAFGHPIALAMFLSSSALVALGAALATETASRRRLWFISAAALVVGQALTLSRTGWVVLAFGLATLVIRGSKTLVPKAVGTALLAVIAVVLIASQFAPTNRTTLSSSLLLGGQATTADLARTANYRSLLLERALTPGAIQLLGNHESALQGVAAKSRNSVDNEYLYIADQWGFAGLAALLAVVMALVITVLRLQPDLWSASIAAAAVGNVVGLTLVAFITQQQVLIWCLIGACAGAWAVQRIGPATTESRRT